MKKPLVYDSHIVELHQRLFRLLVEVDELRVQGQAYYQFRNGTRGPQVEIKLYRTSRDFKTWRIDLPTTEADFDRIDRQITKFIEALKIEAERRQARDRELLLKTLTPEQLEILNLNPGATRYEG